MPTRVYAPNAALSMIHSRMNADATPAIGGGVYVSQAPASLFTNDLTELFTLLADNPHGGITLVSPISGMMAEHSLDLPVMVATAIHRSLGSELDWGGFTNDVRPGLSIGRTFPAFMRARSNAIKPPRGDLDPEAYTIEMEESVRGSLEWPDAWTAFMDSAVEYERTVRRTSRNSFFIVTFTDLYVGAAQEALRLLRGMGHPRLVYLFEADTTLRRVPVEHEHGPILLPRDEPGEPGEERTAPKPPPRQKQVNAWTRLLDDD